MESFNNTIKRSSQAIISTQIGSVGLNRGQDELMRTLANFLIDRILDGKHQSKLKFMQQKT